MSERRQATREVGHSGPIRHGRGHSTHHSTEADTDTNTDTTGNEKTVQTDSMPVEQRSWVTRHADAGTAEQEDIDSVNRDVPAPRGDTIADETEGVTDTQRAPRQPHQRQNTLQRRATIQNQTATPRHADGGFRAMPADG